MRFPCGNDTVAVAMHFAMKNGQICFSLRKFLAISPAIQKIASDCGCDAVVHLGVQMIFQILGTDRTNCPSNMKTRALNEDQYYHQTMSRTDA